MRMHAFDTPAFDHTSPIMPTGVCSPACDVRTLTSAQRFITDEPEFKLGFLNGCKRVKRHDNGCFKDFFLADHDRVGGGSINVFKGISCEGRTDIYAI